MRAGVHHDSGGDGTFAEDAAPAHVSITRLAASGRYRSPDHSASLSGTAWFDHEWGPGALPKGAVGWDWFALQLSDGSELMLYRLRGADGGTTPYSAGTFVSGDGAPARVEWPQVRLRPTGLWVSPHGRRATYPAGWQIAVLPFDVEVSVEPLLADQELSTAQSAGVTYWEGTCRVSGKRRGRPVGGRAYAELTGYAGRDVPGFAQSPGGDGLGVADSFPLAGARSLVSSVTMNVFAFSRFR